MDNASTKKLVIIVGNCRVDKKVLKNYFCLEYYKSMIDVTKQSMNKAIALVVKGVSLKKEELDNFEKLERIIRIAKSLELYEIKIASMLGIELTNSLPDDIKSISIILITSVFAKLPLVVVLNRSDCTAEFSILKNVARLSVFDFQISIPEKVLYQIIGIVALGNFSFSKAMISKLKILRIVALVDTTIIDSVAAGARGIAISMIPEGDKYIAAKEVKAAIDTRIPYSLGHWKNVNEFKCFHWTPFWHQVKEVPLYSFITSGVFSEYSEIAAPLNEGLTYDGCGKVVLTPLQASAVQTMAVKGIVFIAPNNVDPLEAHSHLKIDGNLYFPSDFGSDSYTICGQCGLWSKGLILTHIMVVYHTRMKHTVNIRKLEMISTQCSSIRNGVKCSRKFYILKEQGPLPSLHCRNCEKFTTVNSGYFPKAAHDKPNQFLREFRRKKLIIMRTSAGVTLSYSTRWD